MFLTCHLLSQTFVYKLGAKGLGKGGGKSLSLWLLGQFRKKGRPQWSSYMCAAGILSQKEQRLWSRAVAPDTPPLLSLCRLKSFHLPQSQCSHMDKEANTHHSIH